MLEKNFFNEEQKSFYINSKEYENIKIKLQKSLEECYFKLNSIDNIDNSKNQIAKELEPTSSKTVEPINFSEEKFEYSKNIMEKINYYEEYNIYKEANLVENEEGNLIRTDIDPEQKDQMGRTNKERCEQGLPPIDKNGNPIELHHIGQKNDSPLAELTQQEHRGKGNDTILHDKTKESEIDREAFAKERKEYWKNREL